MLGISSKPTVNKEMNHLAGQFSALGQVFSLGILNKII